MKSPRNQDDVDKLLKLMMSDDKASSDVEKEIGNLVKKYKQRL